MKTSCKNLEVGDEILTKEGSHSTDLDIVDEPRYVKEGDIYFVMKVVAIKKAKITIE